MGQDAASTARDLDGSDYLHWVDYDRLSADSLTFDAKYLDTCELLFKHRTRSELPAKRLIDSHCHVAKPQGILV